VEFFSIVILYRNEKKKQKTEKEKSRTRARGEKKKNRRPRICGKKEKNDAHADPYSIHLTGRAGTGRTSEDEAGYDMEVVPPDG
jgi:hypothetical protein